MTEEKKEKDSDSSSIRLGFVHYSGGKEYLLEVDIHFITRGNIFIYTGYIMWGKWGRYIHRTYSGYTLYIIQGDIEDMQWIYSYSYTMYGCIIVGQEADRVNFFDGNYYVI